MKYVVQIVDHTNGQRTEPFVTETRSLVKTLMECTLPRENLILCVGYIPEDNHEMQISGNPLMTIDTFLKANNIIEDAELIEETAHA